MRVGEDMVEDIHTLAKTWAFLRSATVLPYLYSNLESEFGNFGMGAKPDEPISIVSIGRAIGRTVSGFLSFCWQGIRAVTVWPVWSSAKSPMNVS